MNPNPNLLSQAAHQHITDMHQTAAHRTARRQATARQIAACEPAPSLAGQERARLAGAGRGASIRNRAGWTLVQIGLRLATRSADA